jgi:chaperonin GroEL
VAIARIVGSEPPEILDSAATIARRTIQMVDPFEDMGAMIVRHLAWRVFDRVGDGTATAAVLAQSLVQTATKYIAAGASPVSVKRGIELGLPVATSALRRQARTIDAPSEIANVVAGTTRSAALAEMIGEAMDAVGPDGAILVEAAQGSETRLEYIDGIRWNEGYVSSFMLKAGETSMTSILEPRVLVTDYSLDRAEQLVPVLEACVAAGARNLFIVAPEVRDSAVGLLVLNRERGVIEGAIAVKAPSFGTQRMRILEDIAVVCGGRFVSHERGGRLADVTIGDLGTARQAWATRSAFGILGGRGEKGAIRQRIAEAKAELRTIETDDYTRDKIRERIGKLAGTASVISVGAPSKSEQEDMQLRVEAAVMSARAAVQEGVVPGGGAALLACAPMVEAMEISGDEALGVKALGLALTEPMRAIVENAGFDAELVLAHSRSAVGDGCLFDVVRREWVNAWAVGVVDPLEVTLTALETAVSTATTVLTADVLIHRKKPPMAANP